MFSLIHFNKSFEDLLLGPEIRFSLSLYATIFEISKNVHWDAFLKFDDGDGPNLCRVKKK